MEREVERRNREAKLLALAASTLDPSLLSSPRPPRPQTPSPTAPSSLLQMWRELEHRRADAAHRFDREPSPDNADRDRERVRQIARSLTDTADGPTAAVAATAATGGVAWRDGEAEVSLVREWVQMASQPRDYRAGARRDELAAGADRDRQGEPPRLRGRQTRLGVISRMARERQRELQGISGYHVVWEFPRRSFVRVQLHSRLSAAPCMRSALLCAGVLPSFHSQGPRRWAGAPLPAATSTTPILFEVEPMTGLTSVGGCYCSCCPSRSAPAL